MAMERVVFLMKKAEKEQLKVYCDAHGFGFGKWMRVTLLQSAGIKKVTEVVDQPEEVATHDQAPAEKDLF